MARPAGDTGLQHVGILPSIAIESMVPAAGRLLTAKCVEWHGCACSQDMLKGKKVMMYCAVVATTAASNGNDCAPQVNPV